MRWKELKLTIIVVVIGIMFCAASYAVKKDSQTNPSEAVETGQSERQVTEADVPAAALAALKKQAEGAKFTEFAEEIEYGHVFYEGSWKSADGRNIDCLVTSSGDLVEIEEEIQTGKVPAAVLKEALKTAGEGASLECEKKTMILYEVKFQKGEGGRELLLTPDGRFVKEEAKKSKAADEDEDNDNDEDDDDVDD